MNGFEFRAADSLSPSLWKSHLEVTKTTLPSLLPPSHWWKWIWEMEGPEGTWSSGTSYPKGPPHRFSGWLHFHILILSYSVTILGSKMLFFFCWCNKWIFLSPEICVILYCSTPSIIVCLNILNWVKVHFLWASQVAQWERIHLPVQETQFWSLNREDPLQEEMATHSSILAGWAHGQRSLVGYSPWVEKESDTTQQLNSMHTLSIYLWSRDKREKSNWHSKDPIRKINSTLAPRLSEPVE